jgi:hypothetical protein
MLMKPFGRTDFDRAFRRGETFTASHLGTVTARQNRIGMVILPSGQLIACDPSYMRPHDDIVPFTKTVQPGAYPVTLAFVDDVADESMSSSLITCARIDFSAETPTTWELALLPGQDSQTLPLGKFFGFGVDCGMACFLDELTHQHLLSHQPWDPFFSRLERPWSQMLVDSATGANLIAFKAGYGDGAYPSYWGLNDQSEICCFVTDFHVLVENVEDEAHFILREWKEIELTHADFNRIGMTVRCLPRDSNGYNLWFQMTGDCPTIIIHDRGREYHSDSLVLRQYGSDEFEYRFAFKEPLSSAATVTIRYDLGVTAL